MRMRQQMCRMTLAALLVTLTVAPLPLAAQSSGAASTSAPELLRRAAGNFANIRALHFTLTTRPALPGFRLAAIASGEADAIWPDQMVFRGSMQTSPALAVPIVIAMCGPDRYADMGDGTFQKMEGIPNVLQMLFASDSGLVTGALKQLQQVSSPQAATIDNVATWRVAGVLPSELVAKLPGRTTVTKGPVKAEFWISQKEQRLRQATFVGPMFDGDSAQTTRTLTFSRYNEQITLTVPRGRMPCGAKP